MNIQISGIKIHTPLFKEILKEQGYLGAEILVDYEVFQIPHDLSKECRNLCADLLDEGFSIELVASTGLTSEIKVYSL